MKRILIALLTLGISSSAFASTLLGLSLTKYQWEGDGSSLSGKFDVMDYDVKLGFASQGLYLGGIYSGRSQEDFGRTAYGVSVGYHDGGFFVDGHYYLASTIKLASAEINKGSGFGADIGYNWMLKSSFYMGLQMSYKSFTYKQVSAGGVDADQDNKEKSEMYPMVNLGFAF